jgi:hypothetical protein
MPAHSLQFFWVMHRLTYFLMGPLPATIKTKMSVEGEWNSLFQDGL